VKDLSIKYHTHLLASHLSEHLVMHNMIIQLKQVKNLLYRLLNIIAMVTIIFLQLCNLYSTKIKQLNELKNL